MAVPSDLNPVLAINLPLVFEHPPGQNSATEALRLSLLGVGAIHQAYLLSRHGVNSASQQEMMNLAVTLRLTATHYLRMACLSPQGMESDAALGASITIALIDIFTGGQNWTANLALAKTLIDLRGGPRTIIATNKPHLIDGGAKVSPARLLLEILAVYDTFGSLTTGEPPTILAPGSEDWWFDGDKSSYHLFSVEKVFGMSRAMIELVARVSCLAARANKHRRKIVELEEAEDGRSPQEQEEYERQAIESEAMALYEEAKTWTNAALKHRLHPRVEYGNTAHRQAMQVILLRDVLRVDRKDPRVQEAVQSILKICTDSAKRLGMGVDLTWPVIVAGCQVEKEDRDKVLKAFESFREQCCFDIDTAERIVREVWKRLDANPNDPRADWRSVTEDLDLKVLLL
ncbi:hypothetical protein CALCODRAFT_502684 [Calocera cornea HHB12733]|uniref:Uncharacterized protein n=1 Tax=Calocera cornea HHB12733 TaxID=1353952 RepID=A0A165D551_9BASI|nr:hypothetical protein CALCODRAFT_502684 [Calocera cornea HHB12733]